MDRNHRNTIGIASPLADAIHGLSSAAAIYGSDIIAKTARLSACVGAPYFRVVAMHNLEEARTAIKYVSDALAKVDAVIAAELAEDDGGLDQAAE